MLRKTKVSRFALALALALATSAAGSTITAQVENTATHAVSNLGAFNQWHPDPPPGQVQVPEPGTVALLAAGAGLIVLARKVRATGK
jgi:hypothetical protein